MEFTNSIELGTPPLPHLWSISAIAYTVLTHSLQIPSATLLAHYTPSSDAAYNVLRRPHRARHASPTKSAYRSPKHATSAQAGHA